MTKEINMATKAATLLQVKSYFGFETLKDFQTEWNALSADDQMKIKTGLGDGTMTY